VGCVGCVGGVEVWALWGCGVTPYVRHFTDCTCCDLDTYDFFKIKFLKIVRSQKMFFIGP
jgi:hypothetical protein